MGGGDLNMKKSWHPVLLVNQERVWKAEKSANEEKKKLQQLRKEQEEERQLAELQRLQEQSTGKKRVEKLDWMYAAPSNEGGALGGAKISETMMEDYLLGKRRVDDVLAAGEKNVGHAHQEFIAVQNANTARDTAAKIREDPLLAIKRQEQAALAAMANRPDIRKQLKAMQKEKSETKEERRARRKAEKEDRRREKREAKRYRHSDSRSPRSEYSDEREYRHSRRSGERRYTGRDERDGSRSSSPRRDRNDRYRHDRDGSPRRKRDESPRRGDGYRRDDDRAGYRDGRREDDRHANGHVDGHRDDRDDRRIPPPRDYSNGHDTRDVKPHPSRPGALDMADRPTSSTSGQRADGGAALDDMRAARLAAMTASAAALYSERGKTLAQRAEEEKREQEQDERMRVKYGREGANAGFFKQQGELGLGEALQRRAGKGLQRDI